MSKKTKIVKLSIVEAITELVNKQHETNIRLEAIEFALNGTTTAISQLTAKITKK